MESSNCEFYGCIYNINGRCSYDDSAIRIESAKACYDEYYVDDEE